MLAILADSRATAKIVQQSEFVGVGVAFPLRQCLMANVEVVWPISSGLHSHLLLLTK